MSARDAVGASRETPRGAATEGDTRKISMNLTIEVFEFLRKAASRENVTMTEIFRRALSVWRLIDDAQREGKTILLRDGKTKEVERIHFHSERW